MAVRDNVDLKGIINHLKTIKELKDDPKLMRIAIALYAVNTPLGALYLRDKVDPEKMDEVELAIIRNGNRKLNDLLFRRWDLIKSANFLAKCYKTKS